MSLLDGFEPITPKRNFRSKWQPAEMVAEFLAMEEICIGKEYQDEEELKGRMNSLRQYLQRPPGKYLGVSVHKSGNMIILCKDGGQNENG